MHARAKYLPDTVPENAAEFALSRSQSEPRRRPERSRRRVVRARTISVKRISKREVEFARLLYPDDGHALPATRGDCVNGPRPCPLVSCKYNLYLDVSPDSGAIKLNFPDLEVWELGCTCALDIADSGPRRLEDVGPIMNVTRERARQLEVVALGKLERLLDRQDLEVDL